MADHGEFREEFPDEHPHSYDHTEPKGSLLFVLFGITVVLVALIGIGVQFYYDTLREKEIYERVLVPPNTQLVNLRTEESKELHSYGYADKNAGRVRLSIDRAMELVAQEAAENRSKYPTNPYAMKTAAELAQNTPAVSQPGAAAANNNANQGVTSNPNAQQQPAKPGH